MHQIAQAYAPESAATEKESNIFYEQLQQLYGIPRHDITSEIRMQSGNNTWRDMVKSWKKRRMWSERKFL